MRLSTRATPGADHAVRSASARSAQDFTVPRKITSPPFVSTVMQGFALIYASLLEESRRARGPLH